MKTVKISVNGHYPDERTPLRLTYSSTDPQVTIRGSSIEIPYKEVVILEFELQATVGKEEARMKWAHPPFRWAPGKSPSNKSKWIATRVNDTIFVLEDPVEIGGEHSFYLDLLDPHGEQHSSPDPTVVNKGAPPDPPDDDVDELMAALERLHRRNPRAALKLLAEARARFTRRR